MKRDRPDWLLLTAFYAGVGALVFSIVFAIYVLCGTPAFAAEEVTLTAPVAKPSQTLCKLDRITIDVTAKSIMYQVLGNNGEIGSKVYDSTTTPTGAQIFTNINKRNFAGANPSMVKATLERLALDGICVGAVAGTPD